MFCTQYGNKPAETDFFCARCGAPVKPGSKSGGRSDDHGSIQRCGQAGDWSSCPKCYGNKYCTACGGTGKRD